MCVLGIKWQYFLVIITFDCWEIWMWEGAASMRVLCVQRIILGTKWGPVSHLRRRERNMMMTGVGKNVAIFTANEHDRIMILTCPRILTAQDYSWHIKIPCLGKSHFRIKTSEHPWATRQHSAIIPPAVYWFIFNRHFWENRKQPSILNKTKYFRLRPYDEVS